MSLGQDVDERKSKRTGYSSEKEREMPLKNAKNAKSGALAGEKKPCSTQPQ